MANFSAVKQLSLHHNISVFVSVLCLHLHYINFVFVYNSLQKDLFLFFFCVTWTLYFLIGTTQFMLSTPLKYHHFSVLKFFLLYNFYLWYWNMESKFIVGRKTVQSLVIWVLFTLPIFVVTKGYYLNLCVMY